jgi:hypothetical protein
LAETEESKKMFLLLESERERTGRNYLKKAWKRLFTFNGAFAPYDTFKFSQYDKKVSELTAFN